MGRSKGGCVCDCRHQQILHVYAGIVSAVTMMQIVETCAIQQWDLTAGGSKVTAATVFAGCVLSLFGLLLYGKIESPHRAVGGRALRKKPKEACVTEGRRYSRRLSYTSANMLVGGFPPSKEVPETIIHGVLCFHTLPSGETLVEMAKKLMRANERCGGIPTCVNGDIFWRMRQLTEEEIEAAAPCLVRTKEVTDIFEGLIPSMKDPLGDMHSRPLDAATCDVPMELPWWEFLVLKNTSSAPDALHAVVLRFHHGLGDGLSVVGIMQVLCTRWDGGGALELKDLLPASMVNKLTTSSSSSKTKKSFGYLNFLGALFRLVTLPISRFDDSLRFRKSFGPKLIHNRQRVLVKFPPVPVSFIRSLKDAADVAINDILMTCIAQVIRDYCNDRGDDDKLRKRQENLLFRTLLPVVLPHPLDEDGIISVGNKWVMLSVEMGVGYENILDRLKFISQHIQRNIKESPSVGIQMGLQEVVQPKLPVRARQQAVYDVFVRHSLVFSNVPGPNVVVGFGGQEVVEAHNVYNNLINQMGFLTYAGSLYGNLVVDPEMIRESETLPVYYCRALRDLGQQLQVEIPESVLSLATTS